ncbi:MAG TPA: hypothetical protein VI756_00940, partial [Blastocatellia bacterium]
MKTRGRGISIKTTPEPFHNMKFNKPINRDVEVAGNAFIVGMDNEGVTFRLKGKRKVVRTDWQTVLDAARGEDGELPAEYLGLNKHASHAKSEKSIEGSDASSKD